MAKKTKVQIAVETTGSKKAAKEIESVGRQQTRLGQASASAGREFSAQASGLGGLVSAYAGAAATIFALSAAFDALNRAARAEQTLAGVNALAAGIGESGPEVLSMIQRITKGQLSLVQAAELANLALSSGFSTEQLEGFTDVAMRASRALGRDLTDSFQRLVRGAVKLEPELLDELGIFTRIEPAAEAYAASVGKVASQLSRFEKRQAFANAVSEEGARKYADIDIEADTAAQSLEKLAATVSDLATNIGGVIARALAPFAEILTSPIAAIGLMGVLIKTVFGTALREATQRLTSFNANLRTSTDNLQDNLSSTKRIGQANLEFSEGMKGVTLNVARASAANEAEFKSLTKKAKAQTITTAETRRYNQIIEQEIAALNREKAALENSGKATAAKTARIGVLERRVKQFTIAQTAANARLKAFGPVAKAAGAAAIGFGKAVASAGKIALRALGIISMIVTTLSILITVGATVLDAFGWLDIVVEKTQKTVRFLKELLSITKEFNQAGRGIESVVENIDIPDTLTGKGIRPDGRIGKRNRKRSADSIRDAVEETVKAAPAAGFASADEFVKAFEKQLGIRSDSVTALARKLFKKIGQESQGTMRGRTLFAEAGGMTLKAADKVLEARRGELRVTNDILKNESLSLQKLGARFASAKEYNGLTEEDKERLEKRDKAQLSILQSQQLQVNFLQALRSGSATIEQLEQKRGAILAKIKNLLKEGGDTNKETAKILQKDLDNLNENAEVQIAILKTRKQIQETFSAQIKAADQLGKMNILTLEGDKASFKIAVSKKEQSAAQLTNLQQQFAAGKEFLDVERGRRDIGRELTDIEKQRAALARTAELAIVGQFQAIVEQSQKLKDNLDKQTLAYKNQITLLKQQNALQSADRSLKLSEQRLKTEQKSLANSVKTLQVERALAKARAEGADLDRQGRNKRATDIAAEFGDLLSPQRQRALELRIARSDLEALRKTVEAQKATIRDRAALEKTSLEKQQKELQAQLGGEGGGLIAKRFAAQRALDLAKIKADQETRELTANQLEAQVKLLDKQLDGFRGHVEGLARILAADRIERQLMMSKPGEFAQGGRTVAQERKFRLDQQMEGVATEINNIIAKIGGQGGGLTNLLNTIRTRSDEIFKLQQKNVGGKTDAAEADARLKAQEALNDILEKIKNNATITATEIQKLDNKLKEAGISTANLAAKFADADNEMLQIAKDVASSLSGGIAQGLRDLNDALLEGTLTMENFKEGFKETFINIAKDIQGKIFERTVVKPVESFINEKVLGAFGFAPDKKIEDALVTSTGGTAMLVTMAPSATSVDPTEILKKQCDAASVKVDNLGTSSDTGGNFLMDMFGKIGDVLGDFGSALLEAGQGVFDFVGSLFQGISGLGGGGGGGFFGSIFKGFGSFFGNIFGGGASVAPTVGVPVSPSILPPVTMFAARGGLVKRMAAGGMLRDRIPAMLEPGEFVIRKPMAKAIGGPALNAMNAHGAMGGPQNVVVNMHNEGTAQETSEQPSVQVSPETIIVDIVTRDLKNNGPIRQGIRKSL